jgi:hypothetical protein
VSDIPSKRATSDCVILFCTSHALKLIFSPIFSSLLCYRNVIYKKIIKFMLHICNRHFINLLFVL